MKLPQSKPITWIKTRAVSLSYEMVSKWKLGELVQGARLSPSRQCLCRRHKVSGPLVGGHGPNEHAKNRCDTGEERGEEKLGQFVRWDGQDSDEYDPVDNSTN